MVVMLSGGSAQANCAGAGAVQPRTRQQASLADVRCTSMSQWPPLLPQAAKSQKNAWQPMAQSGLARSGERMERQCMEMHDGGCMI